MTDFEGFGLSAALNKSLQNMNYSQPTPIQQKAIPLALQGKDILGSAQTGTGKTAAFSIPLVEMILRSPLGGALVLTPTRELAKQVLDVIHQLLGPQSQIKTAFLIGGEPMGKQMSQLRARPRIIVGTPGRINDHLARKSLQLNQTDFLVLDETDRMLDMGFGVQLDKILTFLPEKRQTLMFSATLPKGIVELSGKYLNKPERVSVGETNVVALNIKQDIVRIEQDQKYNELIGELHERTGSVIIFIKTKHGADRMANNLCRDGFEADALHGDLKQNKRTRVMGDFRNKKFRILVATDIAARGLDVPHIEHVINYDLPQVAEDYIHRMGRTARAGAQGSALCFVSSQDMQKWKAIERLLNPSMAKDNDSYSQGNRSHSNKGGPRKGFGGKKPFNAGGKGFGKPQGNAEGRKNYTPRPQGEGANDRGYAPRPQRESEGRKDYAPRPQGNGEGRKDFAPRPQRDGEGRKDFAPRPARNSEARKDYAPRPQGDGEGRKSYGGKPQVDGKGYAPRGDGEARKSYGGKPQGNGKGKSYGPKTDGGNKGKSFGGKPKPAGNFGNKGKKFGAGKPSSRTAA